MGRKCSQCGNTGHNLRTCTFNNTQSLRLFGVQLNLTSSSSSSSSSFLALNNSHSAGSSSSSSSSSRSSSSAASFAIAEENADNKLGNRYESGALIGNGITQERKKGVPWTEEEHKKFLLGLEILGKGDWRGISRDFVTTRTPTQVASHAQKFFLGQISINKRRRRGPSLFDIETCQAPIQNLRERNNFCGLTLDTTKASVVADGFSLMKLDSFASGNPNFEPDLDLKLNCNISSFNASK